MLIGGAAINRDFGRRILYPRGKESDELYEPGVFYCKDAFQGLDTMDALIDEEARAALVEKTRDGAKELREKVVVADDGPPTTDDCVRSAVRADAPIPEPPFWGVREVDDRPRRGLPLPRPPRALQAALGRARQEGRGVAASSSRARRGGGLRAEARADVARAGLPPAAREARLLPLQRRRQRAGHLRPRGPRTARSSGSSSRASPSTTGSAWPTSTGPSTTPASATSSPCRASPSATEVTELIDPAREGRRVRRAALRPRPRRAVGRGRWPSGCTPRLAPTSASSPTRAGATPGATRPARTSPSTRRSGACSAWDEIGMYALGRHASSPSSRRWRSSPTTRRPSTSA